MKRRKLPIGIQTFAKMREEDHYYRQLRGLLSSVFYSYFAGLGMEIIPEDANEKGRIDMTALFNDHIYIIHSIRQLFADFPRLAGIHLNIEPMPSGNQAFLVLLEELKRQLPPDKILSVAAYPPPTIQQPVPEVHWDRDYYQQVARHADQMVIMIGPEGSQFPANICQRI